MVAMNFNTEEGIRKLNAYMADKSYMLGYEASQSDVAVFEALNSAPPAVNAPHALRWYNHLKSFSQEAKGRLGGAKKPPPALSTSPAAPPPQPAKKQQEEDDDVDLFGSDDEEDAEAAKLREKRLAEYAEKKSKKATIIAKSSIVLDVKPWDDETDMKKMEESVRTIQKDGLVWGASKLVPVGYGINKLQIMCVVEDEKVSVDDLADDIQLFDEFVQSVDIAAFNKI